jgi:hypothetical protein
MRVIRFIVENFRSIRDRVELSFESTALSDEPLFRIPSTRTHHGLLPVVGIYGANASGKSNVVDALLEFRDAVGQSFSLKPDQSMPWSPWRMDRSATAPPTRLELEFEHEGVRYLYGYVHRDTCVEAEWLHQWPAHRRQVVFERDIESDPVWYFGPSMTGPRQQLSDQTRNNCLFLSLAKQQNHELLTRVAAAIGAGIRNESEIELRGYPIFSPRAAIVRPEHRELVINLLRAGDLGVVDLLVEEVDMEIPDEVLQRLPAQPAAHLRELMATNDKPRRIVLLHESDDQSEPWSLAPGLESRGTQILLQRINDVLEHRDGLLIVDELETSLHPDLCAALLHVFTRSGSNSGGRQLLFTTHSRDLLGGLRADEIVLLDRKNGSTCLRAMSDYRSQKVRGRADFRALHERGLVGGVPILGDWQGIWERVEDAEKV